MARKFYVVYVVWKGHQPGVYASWDEAAAQVGGFKGAQYKAFPTREAAEKAFRGHYDDYVVHRVSEQGERDEAHNFIRRRIALEDLPPKVRRAYAVDAASNSDTREMEYRCVKIETGEEVFHQGPFKDATNNVGEFLAIVHALSLFKKRKIDAPIYSDSLNAISWVAQAKCKTRLERTERNAKLFEMIERAEAWLRENDYATPVLKWDTQAWGENPADFGRK